MAYALARLPSPPTTRDNIRNSGVEIYMDVEAMQGEDSGDPKQ